MEPERPHPPHLPADPPPAPAMPPPPVGGADSSASLSPWQQQLGAQQAWQQQLWQQQMLERELASTRAELEAMQELLQELPEIFERKFQQRLQPLLEHQQRLLSENEGLRTQMRLLGPAAEAGAAPLPLEPPATVPAPAEAGATPAAPVRPPLQWKPFQTAPGAAPTPPPPTARPEPPEPGAAEASRSPVPRLPQLPQPPRIPQAVRHAFGLGGRKRKPIKRRSDAEPPTDG